MLVFNPKKRIAIEDALADAYFDPIRDPEFDVNDLEPDPIDFSFDEGIHNIQDVKSWVRPSIVFSSTHS